MTSIYFRFLAFIRRIYWCESSNSFVLKPKPTKRVRKGKMLTNAQIFFLKSWRESEPTKVNMVNVRKDRSGYVLFTISKKKQIVYCSKALIWNNIENRKNYNQLRTTIELTECLNKIPELKGKGFKVLPK